MTLAVVPIADLRAQLRTFALSLAGAAAVDSNDDGASWTLLQEMKARRRSP